MIGRPGTNFSSGPPGPAGGALCLETQGREVMAKLVHDVVAEAMRLDIYGAPPPGRVMEANGSRFGRDRDRKRS